MPGSCLTTTSNLEWYFLYSSVHLATTLFHAASFSHMVCLNFGSHAVASCKNSCTSTCWHLVQRSFHKCCSTIFTNGVSSSLTRYAAFNLCNMGRIWPIGGVLSVLAASVHMYKILIVLQKASHLMKSSSLILSSLSLSDLFLSLRSLAADDKAGYISAKCSTMRYMECHLVLTSRMTERFFNLWSFCFSARTTDAKCTLSWTRHKQCGY